MRMAGPVSASAPARRDAIVPAGRSGNIGSDTRRPGSVARGEGESTRRPFHPPQRPYPAGDCPPFPSGCSL